MPAITPPRSLKLLRVRYDVTPMKYIAKMAITEVGMLPPTSVPVVIREYHASEVRMSDQSVKRWPRLWRAKVRARASRRMSEFYLRRTGPRRRKLGIRGVGSAKDTRTSTARLKHAPREPPAGAASWRPRCEAERPGRKAAHATMRARAFSAIRIALISLLMSSMN